MIRRMTLNMTLQPSWPEQERRIGEKSIGVLHQQVETGMTPILKVDHDRLQHPSWHCPFVDRTKSMHNPA